MPQKLKRSAFDSLPPTAPVPAPEAAEAQVPHLGPAGTAGLRLAGEKKRPRNWEREHQYGRGYTVKGIRPDILLWLAETATTLDVRVAELAEYVLRYSLGLVSSGNLKVNPRPQARGALMTLFPKGYDGSGGKEAEAAIRQLVGRSKTARGKPKKKNSRDQVSEDWKKKPVTWTRFDQQLKTDIIEHCRELVPQGEFITYLIERARSDYESGNLKITPHPKTRSAESPVKK